MSIQEAIERGPLQRERRILKRGERPERTISYIDVALREGTKNLKDSGIPQILDELAQIRGQDLVVGKIQVDYGFSVSIFVGWNLRKDDGDYPNDGRRFICDFFKVITFPPGRAIEVEFSHGDRERLEEVDWNQHPEVVEDAIALAYKNPWHFSMHDSDLESLGFSPNPEV